jgi:hypothetical protein
MSDRVVLAMPTAFAAAFEEFATAIEERVVARLAERLGAAPLAAVVPAAAAPLSVKRPAKRHVQMCPVPRCKERAAPVFNMVCAKHKGLPKAQIAKFREQRRAAAAKAAKTAKKTPAKK